MMRLPKNKLRKTFSIPAWMKHCKCRAVVLASRLANTTARHLQCFIQTGIENVFLSLFFGNRIMAQIHLSWLDPHKTRTTTLVGSKKIAVFDDVATSEKL